MKPASSAVSPGEDGTEQSPLGAASSPVGWTPPLPILFCFSNDLRAIATEREVLLPQLHPPISLTPTMRKHKHTTPQLWGCKPPWFWENQFTPNVHRAKDPGNQQESVAWCRSRGQMVRSVLAPPLVNFQAQGISLGLSLLPS